MVSRATGSSLLLSSAALLSILANIASSATNMPTTCYVLDGTHNSAAGFRCNNQTTGHSSCCAIGGICYSNGVCQQSNGNVQDYLRVGCTDPTWQDSACLDQCTTFATDSTAGIRFCDGAITSTTEYCCDNGTFGVGSFACCDTPSSIFAIKPVASFVAQIPLTYSSTSTSSSSSSSTSTSSSSTSSSTSSTSSATTTTSAAATTSASSSGSSSNTAAIGAGVGVPVGLLALAGIGFLFWRHRRNAKQAAFVSANQHDGSSDGGYGHYTDNHTPQEAPGSIPMATTDPKKGYFGGRQYEPTPQEMPLTSPHIVHEMPAEGP